MDSQTLSRATFLTEEDAADIFTYHKWDDAMIAKGTEVREALAKAVRSIVACVPPCPTRTVAIRKLIEARMDCNAAITFGGRF